jgi:hypothetical protein
MKKATHEIFGLCSALVVNPDEVKSDNQSRGGSTIPNTCCVLDLAGIVDCYRLRNRLLACLQPIGGILILRLARLSFNGLWPRTPHEQRLEIRLFEAGALLRSTVTTR